MAKEIKEKSNAKNLNSNLKRLSEITQWFDNQDEVDVEEGLKMVKEAADIIRTSRERLKNIENEFEEIKKEIDASGGEASDEADPFERGGFGEEPKDNNALF